MTLVIQNASLSLFKALRELVKIDGASMVLQEEYPAQFVRSVFKADREIARKKKNGTLKVFATPEEMFADLENE